MNRSLAALAAGAMLLGSSPLALAQDSSSSSVSSSSTSSVSSTSSSSVSSSTSSVSSSSSSLEKGNEWMRPCLELKGLTKAQCIVKHNPGKGNKKDRIERRNDAKIVRLKSDCADKDGMQKVKCLRTSGRKGLKTLIRKVNNKLDKVRTVRGKVVESSTSSASN